MLARVALQGTYGTTGVCNTAPLLLLLLLRLCMRMTPWRLCTSPGACCEAPRVIIYCCSTMHVRNNKRA
jgi:hypothetical protein